MAGVSDPQGGQNYWPGFVDALSNMVMAMIFLVLIFAAVLFNAMQNTSRAANMKLNQALERKTKENDELRKLVATLSTQVQSRSCAVPAVSAQGIAAPDSLIKSAETVANEGQFQAQASAKGPLPPTVRGTGAFLTIDYHSQSVTLDAAAKAALDTALARDHIGHGAGRVEIIAEQVSSTGGATDAERNAFFRALSLRNQFLAEGWKASDIVVKLPYRENGSGPARAFIRISQN